MLFVSGLLISGCGNATKDSEATEETEKERREQEIISLPSLEGIDLEEIVELGNYKGMVIEKEIAMVSDETVQLQIDQFLRNTAEDIKDGVIQEGDIVNVDHTGSVDGEEEEALALERFDFTVGARVTMEGFDEGLIGAKVGTTREIEVKLPEEDYIEGLAGKEAIFTVKVNSIKRPLKEITDEWVAENSDCKTVSEYKDKVKQEIESNRERVAVENLGMEIWEKVLDETTVKDYPKNVIEYGRDVFEQSIMAYAAANEFTLEEELARQDMTMEDYEAKAEESAQVIAKQLLTLNAIVRKEGLKESDSRYQENLKELVEELQLSEEELVKQYGAENVKQDIFLRYVKKMLEDNVKMEKVMVEDMVIDLSKPTDEKR